MLALSNILPCAKRGSYLKKNFKDSLFFSLKHLLDVSQEVIGNELHDKVLEKLNFLSTKHNISALIYAYNSKLIKSIKANDIPYVKSLFESIYNDDFYINNKFTYYNDLGTFQKDLLREICTFELPRTVSFHDLLLPAFEKTKKIIETGLEVLATHLPDWYDEINLLVDEILILNTDNLYAGSSFDLIGLIYINFDYKTETLTDIISFITHESAHLYIFLLSLKDPLVLNPPEERYQPPPSKNVLRLDKRPVIGIFHATFVLARIIYVLGRLRAYGNIPNSEIAYCDDLIQKYKDRFMWGYNIIKQHGKLTDLGQNIVISAKNLIS